jgi:hypothetical protein
MEKNECEVSYCEYLGLGNPIEQKLPKSEALKRFNCKLLALEKYPLIKAMSFVGIKDEMGKWLITNEGMR